MKNSNLLLSGFFIVVIYLALMQPARAEIIAGQQIIKQYIPIAIFSNSDSLPPECPFPTSKYLSDVDAREGRPVFSNDKASPPYIVCEYRLAFEPTSKNPFLETLNAAANLLFHADTVPTSKLPCPKEIFTEIPPGYQCQILMTKNKLTTSNYIYAGDSDDDTASGGQALPQKYFLGESALLIRHKTPSMVTDDYIGQRAVSSCQAAPTDKPLKQCAVWAGSPGELFAVGEVILLTKQVKFQKKGWAKPINYRCQGALPVDPSWLTSSTVYVDCCFKYEWNPDQVEPEDFEKGVFEEGGEIKASITNPFPCSKP